MGGLVRMGIGWGHVRRTGGYLTGLVVACAIVAPIGNFFIVWANQNGWYEDPNRTVRAVIQFLTWGLGYLTIITSSGWFHWIGGIIIGFTVGVYLDAIMRPKEEVAGNPIYREARRQGVQRMSVGEFRQAEALEDVSRMATVAKGGPDQAKAALIANARTLLDDAATYKMGDAEFRRYLAKQAIYYQLQPHLSREFLDYMARGMVAAGRRADGMQQKLRLEVERYESDERR
jgi:hypothetical protein